MKFFRNREFKKLLIALLTLTAFFSVVGFAISVKSGILMIIACVLLSLIFLCFTIKRYSAIDSLNNELDKILHGDNSIDISAFFEGELSILSSEIQKMILRLRKQASEFKDDKIYLADSIADISHQLKTPLTSISLLASLLQEPELSPDKKNEMLLEIQSLIGRMEWLISSLLKISKLDAGTAIFKSDTVNVSELIKMSAAPIEIPIELRMQKLIVSGEDGCSFNGDLLWSTEAIGNILKNCMEHTSDGGTILVDFSENNLFTEIQISDNGAGISSEDIPHIFERFYIGKNSVKTSYGIGLALARMIISKQNGIIKAENKKNSNGSIFTIKFYKQSI